MNTHKVSICVPVYNAEKYIERCASSLFGQTYENIECIFVNDCTPDNSILLLNELMENYPARKSQVKIINHDHNRGVASARNTALDTSTGDCIMYVDADDYIDTNAVEHLVKSMIDSNAGISCMDIINIHGHRRIKRVRTGFANPDVMCRHALARKIPVSLHGFMILKSLFTETQVRFDESLHSGEDYAVTPILIAISGHIASVHDAYYYYMGKDAGSITTTYTKRRVIDDFHSVDLLYKYVSGSRPDLYDDWACGALDICQERLIQSIIHKDKESFNIAQKRTKSIKGHSLSLGYRPIGCLPYKLASLYLRGGRCMRKFISSFFCKNH